MRIEADEERSGNLLTAAIQANGLGNRDDMGLVEGAGKRRAAMTGRSERHPLRSDLGIGLAGVVGVDKPGDVHELVGRRQVARPWIDERPLVAGRSALRWHGLLPFGIRMVPTYLTSAACHADGWCRRRGPTLHLVEEESSRPQRTSGQCHRDARGFVIDLTPAITSGSGLA